MLDADLYDAVIFDMDGVVTDTARMHAAAWKRTFDEYLTRTSPAGNAPPPFSDSDYRAYVDGKQRDDGVTSFLESRGLSLPLGARTDKPGYGTVWALANRKNHEFQRVLNRDGAYAFPSTVAFVHDLRRSGIGVAIISASRNCQQVLDAAGVGDLFEVRVDGIETERLGLAGKPAPDVFIEAARRLGVVPARAVVVEDAVAGVQAGRDGGFGLVIGIDRTGNAPALTASGATVVVDDLAVVDVKARDPRAARA